MEQNSLSNNKMFLSPVEVELTQPFKYGNNLKFIHIKL